MAQAHLVFRGALEEFFDNLSMEAWVIFNPGFLLRIG